MNRRRCTTSARSCTSPTAVALGATTRSDRAIPDPQVRSLFGSVALRRPADPALVVGPGWLPGEVHDVQCSEGRGVVIGQCLDAELVRKRVELALSRNDLLALVSLPGTCSALLVRPTGEVVLLADVVGQFPLYYGNDATRTVFGTSARLVATAIGSSFDTASLALEIACPQAFRTLGSRTAFTAVHQVEPGTALHINDSAIRSRGVQSPVPRERTTLAGAAAELGEVLPAAVAARASASVALSTDFSGGLDSTSLAFLALPHVRSLIAITFAQDGAVVTGDVSCSYALAQLDSRLDHRLVVGHESESPYRHTIVGDLPHASALHLGPVRVRLSIAAELGATTHLVGEGGDQVLSAPHAYLADLASRGDFGLLWRHCTAWARLRHQPPTNLFTQAIRLAIRSDRALLARQLCREPATGWESLAITVTGAPSAWLTTRARDELVGHLLAAPDDGTKGHDAGDRAAVAQLRSSARAQQAVRELAASYGIAAHAPFLDPAVVRACLSVPAWRKADPHVAKPLLRAALTGMVPDAVFTRTTKGDYTASAHAGIRQAMRELKALLREPISADLGLLEPAPVRAVMDRAANGASVPWGALNQVLAVETWLHTVTSTSR
jgi:asparagine synthase (glutamine-hydrolysing)